MNSQVGTGQPFPVQWGEVHKKEQKKDVKGTFEVHGQFYCISLETETEDDIEAKKVQVEEYLKSHTQDVQGMVGKAFSVQKKSIEEQTTPHDIFFKVFHQSQMLPNQKYELLEGLIHKRNRIAAKQFVGNIPSTERAQFEEFVIQQNNPKVISFLKRQFTPVNRVENAIAKFVLDKVYFDKKPLYPGAYQKLTAPYLANALFGTTERWLEGLSRLLNTPQVAEMKSTLESFATELVYTGETDDKIFAPIPNTLAVVVDISIKIKGLSVGEFMLLPTGCVKHTTLLEIGRSEDETYTVRLFNTGEGIEHHYKNAKQSLYETCYGFTGVPQEDLLVPNHWLNLFIILLSSTTMDRVYDLLNKMCGVARRDPTGRYKEDLQPRQKSGSCAFLCQVSALRYRIIHHPMFKNLAEGLAAWKVVKGPIVHSYTSQGMEVVTNQSIREATELKLNMLGLEEKFAAALAYSATRQMELKQMADYLEVIGKPVEAKLCRDCIDLPHCESYPKVRLAIKVLDEYFEPSILPKNPGLGLQLAQARHERIKKSIEIEVVQSIPEDYLKSKALLTILIQYLQAGNYKKATEVANSIPDVGVKSYVWKVISEWGLKSGNSWIELDTSKTLESWAGEYIETGNMENALKIAKNIPLESVMLATLKSIVEKCIEIGDKENASKVVEIIPGTYWTKSRFLKSIVAKCIEIGDMENALKFAKYIPNTWRMSSVMKSLVPKDIGFGDMEKSRFLKSIVAKCIEIGDMENALKFAKEIRNRFVRSDTLKSIATKYIETDDMDNALKIAKNIPCDLDMSRTLESIATKYIESGDMENAMKIVKEIPCISVARDVLQAYIKKWGIEKVFLSANDIPDGEPKSRLLYFITDEYIRRGELKKATDVAQKIPLKVVKDRVLQNIQSHIVENGKTL